MRLSLCKVITASVSEFSVEFFGHVLLPCIAQSPNLVAWRMPQIDIPHNAVMVAIAANLGVEAPSLYLSAMSGRQRSIGWVSGQVVDRLDLAGATLFETVYRLPTHMPSHEHPDPYVAVLLRGRYREAYRRGEAYFIPFIAVFHPADAQHSCFLNERGCQFFTLELETSWMDSMDIRLLADSVFDWHGGRILWQMLRLLREFRDSKTRFPLTIENLILEILAGLGGERQIGPRLPFHRWKLLEEKVHESFRESIRTRDLASAAGIHPVHVARLFRLKTGMTPGEYLQHLRAQCACRLMQDPERSLGEIASESGFADQSHMNRILKRLVHCSPGNFRLLI